MQYTLCTTLGDPLTMRFPKLVKIKDQHKIVHGAHHYLHYAYLGLVFVESHGLYGYAAGGLLLVSVLAQRLHVEV